MAGLFGKLKKLFGAVEDEQVEGGVNSADISPFIAAIERDDFNEIESARDWVRPEHLAPLIAYYWTLSTWEEKRALIEIVQDRHHDDMRPMMLDFLRAPGDGEQVELAKAVALGFMGEEYDSFMTYYNERELLKRDVQEVLQKHGLTLEKAVESADSATIPATAKPPTASNQEKSNHQRLIDAASTDSVADAQQALADGASLDIVISSGTFNGWTPLKLAINRGQLAVANFLIDQGANVNFRRKNEHQPDNPNGQTPLWWAAGQGHLDLVKRLLAAGADLDATDWYGSTPLMTAAGSGHLEVVDCLVEAGADIHVRLTTSIVGMADGRKPIHLATTDGHALVVAYLLEAGNDPNERGGSGYSMLMVSAENNFYDQAKLLLSFGADVNAQHEGNGIYVGMKGFTPLILAVNAGLVRMTKLLIQAGADVNYRTSATNNYQGDTMPARSVLDFNTGKRAESIEKVLRAAGAGQ